MTCSESTDNAVSFSNQEGVTALVTSTGTESLSDQRAAHRPGVSPNAGSGSATALWLTGTSGEGDVRVATSCQVPSPARILIL